MDAHDYKILNTPEHATLLAPYLAHEDVLSMAGYVQHGSVSTLDHVLRVTALALWLADRLPMRFDTKTVAEAALLHDFYLYDWHGTGFQHAVNHPLKASANAEKTFGLDAAALSAIESHMWPLPPTRPPRSREAVLVNVSDKLAALYETLFLRRKRDQD
jgi:uncharacterized protein